MHRTHESTLQRALSDSCAMRLPHRNGHFRHASTCSSPHELLANGGRRPITRTKQILAEAAELGAHLRIETATKNSSGRNTGALGYLLNYIETCKDLSKVVDALDALSYLVADEAHRSMVVELQGVQVILQKMSSAADDKLLCSSLMALTALARHEDTKALLLASNVLTIVTKQLHHRAGTQVLMCALSLLDAMCFSSADELLADGLPDMLAELLHPSLETQALLATLDLLMAASHTSNASKLTGWQRCMFNLVPLLWGTNASYDVTLCCLDLLLTLSDHEELHVTLCGAGCIKPLLMIMNECDSRQAVRASCVLCGLADHPFAAQRFAERGSLKALLAVLSSHRESDVLVGALFLLRRAVATDPATLLRLDALCAEVALRALLRQHSDRDVVLGAMTLLRALQPPQPKAHTARPKPVRCPSSLPAFAVIAPGQLQVQAALTIQAPPAMKTQRPKPGKNISAYPIMTVT